MQNNDVIINLLYSFFSNIVNMHEYSFPSNEFKTHLMELAHLFTKEACLQANQR